MPMLNGPNSAFHYNLLPVSNKEEKYLTYSVYDEPLLMWRLEPRGGIVGSDTYITPYRFCYGYQSGSNDGCVSGFGLPSCRSRKDTFMQKQARVEGNPVSQRDDNSGLSISDCMEKCWNNCSCVGFTTSNSNGTGCITWTGDLVYQETSGVEGIYVMVHENSPKSKLILILKMSKNNMSLFEYPVTHIWWVKTRWGNCGSQMTGSMFKQD
ncbi:receptor-like serine/threonine-protein kinase SD1-6 [Camellia sinensis]|uniref:receptor-like serine/threonine-protein kinase SD1-6 n=1 Tax=Camellia sinensis TaxID=4442 RepID=UPI0010368BC4|nr:receptor-like serine/threonine-protein kinase SD1-6 [Camellia sinensis]